MRILDTTEIAGVCAGSCTPSVQTHIAGGVVLALFGLPGAGVFWTGYLTNCR